MPALQLVPSLEAMAILVVNATSVVTATVAASAAATPPAVVLLLVMLVAALAVSLLMQASDSEERSLMVTATLRGLSSRLDAMARLQDRQADALQGLDGNLAMLGDHCAAWANQATKAAALVEDAREDIDALHSTMRGAHEDATAAHEATQAAVASAAEETVQQLKNELVTTHVLTGHSSAFIVKHLATLGERLAAVGERVDEVHEAAEHAADMAERVLDEIEDSDDESDGDADTAASEEADSSVAPSVSTADAPATQGRQATPATPQQALPQAQAQQAGMFGKLDAQQAEMIRALVRQIGTKQGVTGVKLVPRGLAALGPAAASGAAEAGDKPTAAV
jgi:type II secretory pathway pseudopilin PulG